MVSQAVLIMFRTEEVIVPYRLFYGGPFQPGQVQRKGTHDGDKGHPGQEKAEVT